MKAKLSVILLVLFLIINICPKISLAENAEDKEIAATELKRQLTIEKKSLESVAQDYEFWSSQAS